METSWELSTALANQIHFRTVTVATDTTHHVISGHKHDSLLLTVPINVGNNTVQAIVDSGSEVNLIHWDIWEQDLKVPMDISATMELHDANGGQSILQWYIPKLKLKISGLTTTVDYWITLNCLAMILLGCP